jgi:hypothetical protein
MNDLDYNLLSLTLITPVNPVVELCKCRIIFRILSTAFYEKLVHQDCIPTLDNLIAKNG